MEDAEQRCLVAAARVARLATVDARGWPHLVPICFALDVDVLYSAVDAKPKRTPALQRLRNVAANPSVTVLVDHYDDGDWSRLWWVRLRGRARTVDRPEERARALALLAGRYEQYRATPPDGTVLAVDVEEWRGWAAAPSGA